MPQTIDGDGFVRELRARLAGRAGRVLITLALGLAAACSSKAPTAPEPTTPAPTALAIASQPQSQTATLGGTLTLNVQSSGADGAGVTFQWYAGESGDTARPIAGATGATYTTPRLIATSRYWVRISDGTRTVDSATATITIAPPSGGPGPAPVITTQPENDLIKTGHTAKLDVGVTGAGPISYQWFRGAAGDTSSPLLEATTDVYWTPALDTTTRYWVRVWNGAGMADSETATIAVADDPSPPPSNPGAPAPAPDPGPAPGPSDPTPPAPAPPPDPGVPPPSGTAPAITMQPTGGTLSPGQAATMTVGATGSGPLAYQWYVGPSGATGSPIAGATGASYMTPSVFSTTTYWVRVSNPYGTVDSNGATVTVVSGSSSAAFEDEVLSLVNARRAAGATCGGTPYPAVGPLAMNETLRQVARAHSLDMAVNGYFSHTSLDGRTFDQRMSDGGYGGPYPWGENIAAGYGSPASVVDGWMNSPGHCTNIMKATYKVIGVGHAQLSGSPYGVYWTQDFGGG
ncbi:MAG: CAP domain-containing protein [Vicinamibacterales bacterium]